MDQTRTTYKGNKSKARPQRSNAQRSQSASKQGASGANRRRKPTRSQRLMRLGFLVFIAAAFVVCGIMLLSATGKKDDIPQTIADYDKQGDTFASGVKVAGVDVGGMTVSEAKQQVDAAVTKQMSEVSISLQHNTDSWTFTAADMKLQSNVADTLVEAMAYGGKNKDGEERYSFPVTLTASKDAIVNRLNSLASDMNTPAVEPHAVPELILDPLEAKFTPVEGRNGLMLDSEETAALIIASVESGRYQDRLNPVFDEIEPTTTLEAVMENIKKISSFTTKYSYSKSDETVQNRCFNIEKAAGILNGTVVQAGAIFSFNELEGPRNAANGWKKANGISGGKEYTLQYGGGICQVSTTLYGAILRANIKIPEGGRRKHSIPSSYVEKGLDATVDTSGIDLKFENDTGAPVYIFAYTVKSKDSSSRYEMVVSIYGKALPEGVEYKPVSEVGEPIPAKETKYTDDPAIPVGYQIEAVVPRDGYTAEVFLEKYENGKLVSRNKLYTDTYGGNAGEVRLGTGDPATVAVPEGAIPVPGYNPPEAGYDDDDLVESGGV